MILDEFMEVTCYQWKLAIRLLRGAFRAHGARRRREPAYDPEIAQALRTAWEVADRWS